MKQYLFMMMVVFTAAITGSCNKVYTEPVNTKSANIDFTIDAAISNISVNSNFPVSIKINSTIANGGGIKVESFAMQEVSGTNVSPQAPSFTTNAANNSTGIINLPQQKWVVATIKLTDIADATNTSSKTFRVIYK